MSDPELSARNKATVLKMWKALSDFDFDTLKSCLHPDVHYEDVPTEDAGANGPENVVARLSVAWDHIDRQIQTTHRIAADGDVVFLDHTEEWIFKTGETVVHRFATMHELKDGKIIQWSDFWDVNNFVGQFPASFLKVMAEKQGSDFTS
ncbi:MAG: nuclear transport factor 2 family protein [bacterium]|nr:nuclear transport factor 2 family protein [bacterium]